MKSFFKVTLIALLAIGGLSGCQSKATNHRNAKSATTKTVSSSQTTTTAHSDKAATPPTSALTTVLSPLTAKLPEDQSSRTNGGETTYSQFYYHQHAWNWQLSSAKRGTIAAGQITGIKSEDHGDAQLTLVTKQGTYSLELMVSGDYYTVKTSYQHISGTYILGDNNQAWQAGVPRKLVGTWSTAIYPKQIQDQPKLAYERTRFYISNDNLDGNITRFTKNYTMADHGTGWGANDEVYSKNLGNGTYLLKAYASAENNLMAVYRVQLVGNQLKMSFGDGPTTLKRVSRHPGLADGSDNHAAASLTKDQISNWIERHLSDFDNQHHDYQKPTYTFGHDNHGRITIDVYDDGANSETAPQIGRFRITAKGVLQAMDKSGVWDSVSDDPAR